MSIANEIAALAQDRAAIAAAITAKGGTVGDGDGFDDFATDIGTIPEGSSGGTPEIEISDVNFFGVHSELLYKYTLEEAQALEALPPLPTESINEIPMTYDWVVTLNTIHNLTEDDAPYNVVVAACPTDGKTHIHISLSEGRLNPALNFCTDGTVDIDWGDGSSHDTVVGQSELLDIYNVDYQILTTPHTYAQPGEYDIKLTTNDHIGWNVPSDYCDWDGANVSNILNAPLEINSDGETIGTYNQAYLNSLIAVEFSNNVTNLDYMSFSLCTNLVSVTIPSSITEIGESAFSCCGLHSINIPNSVTIIDHYAFAGCRGLTSIILPNVEYMGEGILAGCYGLTSIIFPENISTIQPFMFSECNFETLTIPDSITSIGREAFRFNQSLKSVNIPNSVTELSEDVFSWCSNLISVTLPSNLVNIGAEAFYYCLSLSSITIPSSVEQINIRAFEGCYSLGYIKFESSTPPILGTNVFRYVPSDCKFLVPRGSLSTYINVTNYPSPDDYTYEEY